MPIRPLKLPDDFTPLTEFTGKAWQYPENPEWSVQTDELESLGESSSNYNRIWPIIKIVQFFSPALRDIYKGYVWEEDGQMAGVSICNRRINTDNWYISAVGVLPEFRRRGIARKLVEASIELIRERGGKQALLDMIDGNLPAYKLYEKLGFDHYTGSIEFNAELDKAPPEPTLPEGYIQEPSDLFDWEPRFELEKKITPENLLKYEPVEAKHFRRPFIVRLILPLMLRAESSQDKIFILRTAGDNQVVARANYTIRTKGSGQHSIIVRLDPNHADLANYLVQYQLHKALTESPGHKIELSVPIWMTPMIKAAEDAGFERRMEFIRMGLLL